MWFKNLQIYRLPVNWGLTADTLQEKLAAVEDKLGDSGLYEAARKDELRELLAEQAALKAREAELEETWLEALETLEALQQQLEESE